jgi:hypothetical protein
MMDRAIPRDVTRSARFAPRPALLALAVGLGVLVAGTVALWVHYGTAIFYETILAGINACF